MRGASVCCCTFRFQPVLTQPRALPTVCHRALALAAAAEALGIGLPKQVLQVAAPEDGSPVDWAALAAAAPWVLTSKLVVKPDQLIKRRGKGGLLLLNADWATVQAWVGERINKPVSVEGVTGVLTHFLVEPFLPHPGSDEYYVCIASKREGEDILFYHAGGVDVGDVDAKASRLFVRIGDKPTAEGITGSLLGGIPPSRRPQVAGFIAALFAAYMDAHFCYLEINPLVVTGDEHTVSAGGAAAVTGANSVARIVPLDMAAKIDEAASFLAAPKWGDIAFPPPFGRKPEPEEAYIHELDGKTGASLKLTILNRAGRIWTMVAGGGASVVYADTISDLGYGRELANYGEYSGAPSEEQTYEYAKTILGLMGSGPVHPDGKVLIIGGGIANFTDVAKTFTGIAKALREAVPMLKAHAVSIWVRRGGPNYQEGLKKIRALGAELGVPMRVFGPDTHITAIVPLALGAPLPEGLMVEEEGAGAPVTVASPTSGAARAASSSGAASAPTPTSAAAAAAAGGAAPDAASKSQIGSALSEADSSKLLFHPGTRCVVYGMQQRAVQGMLDFDWLCKRAKPSVAAMVFPFSGNHYVKFYWGTSEILMPVFTTTEEAIKRHPDVSVFVNFASFRSVYSTTLEALACPSIRTVAIIAEGVPEQQSRALIREADARGVTVIGPATVGGITPGCFRIGNTGGMIDNIVSCRLYRPGSVGYVSKSGGMSNELNNIMARYTDGTAEGVAIGGDRYPGSRFIDHLLRYQANPNVKMLVLLGEVGGVDEYDVAAALRDGRITKPLVAWCIGTCATLFPFEVQFGHAGALANSEAQTAAAKNKALGAAGAIVPANFNDFVAKIRSTYLSLVASGAVVERPEPPAPAVPMDYAWAKGLGLIRKPANFVSSISDDRGEELTYAGVPISRVFEEGLGVGGVLSLLWFRRRLPSYASKFIEMVLMITADHGPAVAGAHNTIVTARAGKDLISALVSGLLTIGPRFGGALDEAAAQFSGALDAGSSAGQFVKDMRNGNKLIMGIGHRVKSLKNPDKRVELVKAYAKANFPSTAVLDFALAVEQVTTQKKENLILNVDGAIACCFVDLLRSCGAFSREEVSAAAG
jgi:ATP citrate (pro-S)-lyase